MSEERKSLINWGAVVVSLAIIGFAAFALYLTHSLWSLLALLFLCYSGNFQIRPEKDAPKKCGDGKKCCGGKKCGGVEVKLDGNGPDDGRDCGC